MPIAGMSGSKSPYDAFPSQSPLNMIVLDDIQIVVIVYKAMTSNLPINGKGYHD